MPAANKSQEKSGITAGIESSSWTKNSKALLEAESADANAEIERGDWTARRVGHPGKPGKRARQVVTGLTVQHPCEIGPRWA
jgi:hypothetical protein